MTIWQFLRRSLCLYDALVEKIIGILRVKIWWVTHLHKPTNFWVLENLVVDELQSSASTSTSSCQKQLNVDQKDAFQHSCHKLEHGWTVFTKSRLKTTGLRQHPSLTRRFCEAGFAGVLDTDLRVVSFHGVKQFLISLWHLITLWLWDSLRHSESIFVFLVWVYFKTL